VRPCYEAAPIARLRRVGAADQENERRHLHHRLKLAHEQVQAASSGYYLGLVRKGLVSCTSWAAGRRTRLFSATQTQNGTNLVQQVERDKRNVMDSCGNRHAGIRACVSVCHSLASSQNLGYPHDGLTVAKVDLNPIE